VLLSLLVASILLKEKVKESEGEVSLDLSKM
jgi:hypothetical protein